MNRRGFLSGFFKGVAAITIAPQIVVHGLRLRRRLVEPVWLVSVPNPDYDTAKYELGFIFDKTAFSMLVPKTFDGTDMEIDPAILESFSKYQYPIRSNNSDISDPIAPFILHQWP